MSFKEYILVIKHGALGDFIIATSAFSAIRQYHPDAYIVLLTTQPFVELAQKMPYFDEIWVDARPKWWNLKGIRHTLTLLRGGDEQYKFKRIYDLQSRSLTAWYFRLLGKTQSEWVGKAKGCSHPRNIPDYTMHSYDMFQTHLTRIGFPAVPLPNVDWLSDDIIRFLGVLVIATPCPLLIGIPVTIISSISLAAKREIIIKNPAILETIGTCRTAIFDKTGTLTYGRPWLTTILPHRSYDENTLLSLTASVERYSKHPLSNAISQAAEKAGLRLQVVKDIQELPCKGLTGTVAGHVLQVTSRKQFLLSHSDQAQQLPPITGGLECIVLIDQHYAGTFQFRDEVRPDSSSFISHLQPKHLFDRILLVSGDKESEVRFLAEQVGIEEVYFNQSPEQKLDLVRQETQRTKTIYLGDGINDAPSLTAATIGIAFGQNSDITGESADAVIMDSSLLKVDELFHIGTRMRQIALQSAVGGMVLSLIGMIAAGFGYLSPVMGAITQELIDVLAVLNALRAALPPKNLSDY